MNRVVIIGNGFDLAHGMKTGYLDFIEHIKNGYFNAFIKEDYQFIKNNCFFTFPEGLSIRGNFKFGEYSEAESFDSLRRFYFKDDYDKRVYVGIKFKNKFLEFIFDNCTTKNWNGFEYDFNRVLISLLEGNSSLIEDYTIEQLNLDFQNIIDELEKYLGLIELQTPIEFKDDIRKAIYCSSIFGSKKERFQTIQRSNIIFLNFNYTSIPRKYIFNTLGDEIKLDILENRPHNNNFITTDIINIHGELNNKTNKIIFGYGDELDDNQKLIESHNPDYLRYIKSILYTQNNNYVKLLDFINFDEFDVVVLGHSCANSDRTLLNTIFEHDNCVSIQPALRESSKSDIYISIYKNFVDKKKMRSRVIDKIRTVKIS